MPEAGEGMKQATVEFKWEHPANGCPNSKNSFRFIKKFFTADGIDLLTANSNAKVLAENSPQICDSCRSNYVFKGKARV